MAVLVALLALVPLLTVNLIVAARYESNTDLLLQEYFWEDDLWDSITRNDMVIQKCIHDRQWSKLCLCRSNSGRAHPFLCGHGETYGSFPKHNHHSDAVDRGYAARTGDELSVYYFPGTEVTEEEDQNKRAPPPLRKDFRPNCPWKSDYGNLEIQRFHRAHIIPAHLLADFYYKVYVVFGGNEVSPGNLFKLITSRIFDAIYETLGIFDPQKPGMRRGDVPGYDPAHIPSLKDWVKQPGDRMMPAHVRHLQAYIRGEPLLSMRGAQLHQAFTLFHMMFIWAPGNLVYAPIDEDREHPPNEEAGGDGMDSELQPLLPAAQWAKLKEANDLMNEVVSWNTKVTGKLKDMARDAMGAYIEGAWKGHPWIRAFIADEWELKDGKLKVRS